MERIELKFGLGPHRSPVIVVSAYKTEREIRERLDLPDDRRLIIVGLQK
jgi:hypothetical protein